ncbi:MAG: hypothetical protein EBU97_05765 [Rhodobacteraceae bacterium]|nr:hypothetical protein [Paracoccaceae bacterium]
MGVAAVTGTLLGMPGDAVLFGLFGALVMLSRCETVSRRTAFSGLTAGALVAGTAAPVLADVLHEHVALLVHVDTARLRIAAALAVGGCWQSVLPDALTWLRGKFNGGNS